MRVHGLGRLCVLFAGAIVFGNFALGQSALWFPLVETDSPDIAGVDLNLDGIDGMRLGPIFVSAQFGNDSNVGDISRPLKTLPMAMCVAQQLGGRPIYVDTSGIYKLAMAPFANTRIYGGYVRFSSSTTSWSRSGRSVIDTAATLPVYVPDIGDQFAMQSFELLAGSGTADRPSIGIFLADKSPFGSLTTLSNTLVQAAPVGNGSGGANGADGAAGTPGKPGADGKSVSALDDVYGGDGGPSASPIGDFGKGGDGGNITDLVAFNGWSGKDWGTSGGVKGTVGSSRNGGDATDYAGIPANGVNGARIDDFFIGNGTNGADGRPGFGGGGGGGGAARNDITNLSGGGGGSGGSGGDGGGGGKGGRVGPSSIAVVWKNIAASQLDASGSSFITRNAGNGGKGGNGGLGGVGGAGGVGGKGGSGAVSAGKGGKGGAGGYGAGGGGGAGGRGGSSVGIAYTVTPNFAIETTGSTFTLGLPGLGGQGGTSVSRDFSTSVAPPGLSGVSAATLLNPNPPAVTGAGSTSHFLESTARFAMGIGQDLEFSPAIMTADGDLTDYELRVINSVTPRGKLSATGLRLRYQANVFSGPTQWYDEAITYQVLEPIYTILSGVKTRTGTVVHDCTGIISVLRSARATVNLGDWQGARLSGPQDFKLINRNDVAFAAPLNFTNGVSDAFLVPNGDATLRFKTWHWLGRRSAPVADAIGNVTYTFNLVNGDIDGDNQTTIIDYSIFSDYYDRDDSNSDWLVIGANGYRPVDADLDGDGSVSIVDYSIFSDNYDRDGD